MLRLCRCIARRARQSPNAYAILVGVLLMVALPLDILLFAIHADEPTGIPAIDVIRRMMNAVLAEIGVGTMWIFVLIGFTMIFLGAARGLKPPDDPQA